MKRLMHVGAVLVVAATTAAQPAPDSADTTWTLVQCEETALAVSPSLAATRARAEAGRAAADAAGAARLPLFGVRGKASYATEFMKLQTPTATVDFGDGSDTDVMLGLRAPLFTGGSLVAEQRAAESQWRAALADASADSLELRLQVRQAFFAALGGEAAAEAARQGEARLRRHLTDVQNNIEAGMATEEARLQVLARLRRTEQATVQAEAEAAALRFRLGRLLGRSGEQVSPREDLGVSLLPEVPAARPWDARPELQAVDARVNAADHAARAASGSHWPTVELEGGWHYGRPGVDPLTNRWMDYGTVAVSLNWVLFDFGGRSHRVSSLRAESRVLGAVRADVLDALRTRQANARTQVDAARIETDRATERLDLEKRRLTLAHERWREGHATDSELLDAQDDVTLADSDLALARARLRLAEAELLAALGW